MTDKAFIEAIFERLNTYGWQTGRMGLCDGPNCLLGAAGYAEHGCDLKTDAEGVNPVAIGDKAIDGNYESVPGMMRLVRLLNERNVVKVYNRYNDTFSSKEEVIAAVQERLDQLGRFV